MARFKLKDIGTIITGNTPKTSDNRNYDSNDIYFVKPSDIDDNELSDLCSSECYISEYARGKARIVPTQSVLVTCIGIIGKVGINSVDCAFNQQINAIIPNIEKCDCRYLAYAIQRERPKLQSIANAPVVPILNKSQFSDIEISLPPLAEQRKIAAVLDKVSSLIAKRRQQLDKLDDLVKSRFIEMFGDYSFNPKGWRLCRIGDITTDVRYGTSLPASEDGEYPYLRMNNITYEGELDLSEVKRINVPLKDLDKCSVRKGDVLFNRTNSWDKVGKTCVYDQDGMMVLAGFIIRVRVANCILPEFLSAFLNTSSSKEMFKQICKRAIGQANINAEELKSIGIFLPPINLQGEYVAFKQQVDKSKLAIQKSLDKLEILKKALMQKYFG